MTQSEQLSELLARYDATIADLQDEVRALTWELCRMLEGARHLAGEHNARPTMPALPHLRAVFIAEPIPRVEFRDTQPAEAP